MTPYILIVDDNEDNRYVLLDALEDEGYDLRQSRDGAEALAMIEQDLPDVILLDIMMPGMDGIECCRRLKSDERTRHIPVILVTALSADENVIEGLNAGATDYVAKPFAGPVVRARVRAALRWKQAQDKLGRQNAQITEMAEALHQKNAKLAALTDTAHRFVDNVAHEFRTPLSVIKEFSSILTDGLGGPVTPTQQEYLHFIKSATRDLAQMVDDFLDSSKLKARTLRVDRRPHDVGTIFEGLRPVLGVRAAQKSVEIDYEVAPDLPEVFADNEKVARIISNLAVNAIKFSPEGSTVRLWAQTDPGGGVKIGVTDQGPGLTPEDVETVFHRFKQVGDVERSSTKGFGLGLNIAKELIWLNLGTVEVSSRPGAGSTFSFNLPPCDPRVILDSYLERLGELNEAPITISVLRARLSEPAAAHSQLFAFLISSCYPTDLVLMAEDGVSALLIGSTTEPSSWMERLHRLYESLPPEARVGTASHLQLEHLGGWLFAESSPIVPVVIEHLGGTCVGT